MQVQGVLLLQHDGVLDVAGDHHPADEQVLLQLSGQGDGAGDHRGARHDRANGRLLGGEHAQEPDQHVRSVAHRACALRHLRRLRGAGRTEAMRGAARTQAMGPLCRRRPAPPAPRPGTTTSAPRPCRTSRTSTTAQGRPRRWTSAGPSRSCAAAIADWWHGHQEQGSQLFSDERRIVLDKRWYINTLQTLRN